MRRILLLLSLALIPDQTVIAASARYFDFTTGAVLETGDTWMSVGKRYRLYGLQACLRGTSYTDASGRKRDCGEASIAVLAAFVNDTRPVCAPVAGGTELTFVVCYASVGGQRLDLATMMISEGYGFASLNSAGLPVLPAYAVAEQSAREARRGLWRFNDVQHPAMVLSRAVRASGARP
ncbi:thermonuclease family protein [Agrobacterium rubi]|uniref:thermonuclease family protein n=1 Tax=Agrobacterium rubi TaxID=28099 RepID=UPI0015724A24|nr:thermonuclease family protein [Agrobacterium rubi]NTF10666.1 thermonuclease family protein [Agrobacterium rubi]NTF23060.1 thermonuclease family protein [Agrobacterium rubi]NTF29991.1 thermonuclease family protein [Agrobacterium rubi]